MTEFKIRTAKPGDESGIHEAHMRSIREVCVKDHGTEEIRGWGNRPLGNRWIDKIKDKHVWVVETGNQIFGHASISIFEKDGEKLAYIDGLYLTPEALGQGLGQRLGSLMIQTAKDAMVVRINLESTLTAHDFYKKLGFKDTGPMGRLDIAGFPVSYFPMMLVLKY